MSFGVLALQGDFGAHLRSLRAIGATAREVRHPRELDSLAGLVIPGGESTTLLRLMADEPWFAAIRALHARGGAILGTCAGAILLAREVTNPAQESLGLLDVTIERNAWGRQVDSFEARLEAPALGGSLSAVFIRAPRFRAIGPDVEVLAHFDGEPVLVREGHVMAATFHPEIAGDTRLHAAFARTGAVAPTRG